MMKLTALKIRDRLDQPATALFSDQKWDLSFDAGMATLCHRESKEEFLIPASNIIWMKRAEAGKK